MEEWVAYYKQHEALILFIAAWLLSIPTGIFINRLDTYLKNRSKTRKIKEIVTRYAEVVKRRTEIMMYRRNPSLDHKFEMPVTMKTMILTFVVTIVQPLTSNIVSDVFGENASELYF